MGLHGCEAPLTVAVTQRLKLGVVELPTVVRAACIAALKPSSDLLNSVQPGKRFSPVHTSNVANPQHSPAAWRSP